MAQSIAIDITRYTKGECLGSGGFGIVYLYEWRQAEAPQNGIRQMAVKQGHAKEENRDALLKEVDIMCKLTHSNIVQYLGHHVDGQLIQIMIEYMSKGSVRYQLKGSPFSEETTKRYTRDAIEGLRYLHSKKTIHRDIKGDNILIDGEDRAKLADFGLSKIMETNKSAHTFCGTCIFMSPEIILTNLDQTGHGLKTDIWSIGCVVVQMLSSHPPWKARFDADKNQLRLMRAITECEHPEYTLPDGVSNIAKDFIKSCFVIDPKDRPSADDLSRHQFLA